MSFFIVSDCLHVLSFTKSTATLYREQQPAGNRPAKVGKTGGNTGKRRLGDLPLVHR
jgi:hypothetical protein